MKALQIFLSLLFLSQSLHAQNVGIATSSPLSTLHVKGNQRVGGNSAYMRYDSLSGKIEWINSNLFVPVTQALMKHSAAGDGLFYNNSGGVNGQLEYRNAAGNPVFYTNFVNGDGYFQNHLGIGTTNPAARLHVIDSSVLFSAMGTVPVVQGLPPATGSGRRMMWYADKAAFRAGYADGDKWDGINIGAYSFASGYGSRASGAYSTATGRASTASGTYATAMGFGTIAVGGFSTAMGASTQAIGTGATAMGESTMSTGYYTTTMGVQTMASGSASTAMGWGTIAKSILSLSIGHYNDDTDSPVEFTDPSDRIFQIGNGNDDDDRSNAFTVLRNGNTAIGMANAPFPLSFPPVLGDKISLWSNSSNSYGFGIQNSLLQIHTSVAGDDIAFGHGSSAAFNERGRILTSGETGLKLNGRIELKNGTSPLDINATPGIWLFKADNSALLGFMGTRDNQNIGFYGGPFGWGMIYDAINSRVGIGNTSPGYTLDVTGSELRTGNFVNTNTMGTALIGSSLSTAGGGYGAYGEGGYTGVKGQAVLVGTGDRIGVNGLAAGGTDNFGIYSVAIGGAHAYAVFASASGGTTSSWAGYFNGDVYAISYSGSDRKLKNDIVPLKGALSMIEKLEPASYTYNTKDYSQMQFPAGTHYGLIADEVQQVIPGIVKKAVAPAQYENQDIFNGRKLSEQVEFNAVNYTEIISILVGAVKEQQVMIEDQQRQIDELKGMLNK